MREDEKLRFILITSAIVAALVVHRFLDTHQALACPSTGVRFSLLAGSASARTDCARLSVNRDQRQQPERADEDHHENAQPEVGR